MPEVHKIMNSLSSICLTKKIIIEIKNAKGINFGIIPNYAVAKLYSQSKCLVFPSLAESFGIPVIEAIEYGLDVIISDLPYSYSIVETPFRMNPFN